MNYKKHFDLERKMARDISFRNQVLRNSVPIEQKKNAKELLAAMTLDEKIDYISGIRDFDIKPIPRLGIPEIGTSDTTSGVRGLPVTPTFFPAAVAMAASFDKELIKECAKAVAEECRDVGISILLGPGVNMARIPVCGRTFEYMGEDPFLAGEMAASYIQGAQSEGVITTVKHFACNNSDYNRHKENAVVDERVLREIYLPAFEKAVKCGGSLGVMTSYNQVNGEYASQNKHLVEDILRGEWGFKGIVMSDWTSLYDTVGPMKHGVDIEMPGAMFFSRSKIKKALKEGKITEEDIDRKVLRMLEVWEKAGILNRPVSENRWSLCSSEHMKTALEMARESITLLKNNNKLPLKKAKIKRIVLIGYNSKKTPAGGGGSAYIVKDTENLNEELCKRLPNAEVHSLGWNWQEKETDIELVKTADAVLYCTGFDKVFESEMFDRPYQLLDGEAEGIRKACELNSNTIVILFSGGDCETGSWISEAEAVLFAYYLGDKGAEALVDVLLGKINPSGHLPFTIAHAEKDYATMQQMPEDYWQIDDRRRGYPGQGNPEVGKITDVNYSEGLLIGYRWFDTKNIAVDFPFGHGLSYTSFEYGCLSSSVDDKLVTVSLKIKNTGTRKGSDVVQVYVHDTTPVVDKPFQRLAGFERVCLEPGEEKLVTIEIDNRAFEHFDVDTSSWVHDSSLYEIRVGSSSRDTRQISKLKI